MQHYSFFARKRIGTTARLLQRGLLLTIALCLALCSHSFAQQKTGKDILILYYSLTGNTRACCEALQRTLGADILEIKDLKKRP